jgi:hypothetical protein
VIRIRDERERAKGRTVLLVENNFPPTRATLTQLQIPRQEARPLHLSLRDADGAAVARSESEDRLEQILPLSHPKFFSFGAESEVISGNQTQQSDSQFHQSEVHTNTVPQPIGEW